MWRWARLAFVGAAALLVVSACSEGDDDSSPAGGGTAGAGGRAGSKQGGAGGVAQGGASAGSGGTAGKGGAAGLGGTAGTAGKGGAAGTAGKSGAAGTAGKGGSAGAAGKGGSAGAAGKGGSAGAAGSAGTAGKGGSAGAAGTGGAAGKAGAAGSGGATSNPCVGKTDGFYCGLATDSRVLTECKGGVTGTTQTCANGCATATNSCATSNGFAGTEQAGRLTAGMSCEFFAAGTCGDCADAACCTAETACFTNPECLALWNCHVPCTDDACVTACINQHPNGLSGAQGVYACMKSSCYGECGYAADDAYIRYVHAAPGAPGFDVCTRSKGATDWSNNNAEPLFGSFGDGNRFVYRSGASLFFVYNEGDYELRLVPAGSTNCLTAAPQYTNTFSFKAVRGHNYSFVVNWSPVEVAFIEDVPAAVAGQASFQLVNVITQVSTSMEVGRYSSGFTAIGTAPNNNYTQPITVAPFTQKLAFRRSGSGVGFIGSPSGEAIAAIAGSSHTVYLMGQSETGSPQAVMVVCDNDVYQPSFNTKTMSSGCHFTVPVY